MNGKVVFLKGGVDASRTAHFFANFFKNCKKELTNNGA
jgi:hypothetical protein